MLTRRQLLFSLLAPARPNLLLVTFDQLRFDSLGCTGNPSIQTPVIDALAARGTLFTRHFVQVPQCVPSRMSIHTGRYPHTHRTLLNSYQIPDDEPTLARLLSAQGYRTASAGDRPFAPRNQLGGFALHLNHQPGQDHGTLLRQNGYSAEAIKAQQTKANSGYQDAPVPWPESLDEAKHSTDLALNFLAAPTTPSIPPPPTTPSTPNPISPRPAAAMAKWPTSLPANSAPPNPSLASTPAK